MSTPRSPQAIWTARRRLHAIDLRAAEAALENLIIRSPIDGTVLQINLRAGELASPSSPQPLVVVGDVSSLRVRAEVDERDFGEIQVGHSVVVRSTAFRGRDVAGTVVSIAPLIEPGRIGVRGGADRHRRQRRRSRDRSRGARPARGRNEGGRLFQPRGREIAQAVVACPGRSATEVVRCRPGTPVSLKQ